jgi:hypothetical protein
MNRYDYQFTATCPSDGATITYDLMIEGTAVIKVEEILKACAVLHDPAFHEDIADALIKELGGYQEIVATHQGVKITTTRGWRE